MPNLNISPNKLLEIFPRKFENLNLVAPKNNLTELEIIYFQKDTDDVRRNWKIYEDFLERDKIHLEQQKSRVRSNLKLPDNFDAIYHDHLSFIQENLISRKDKILLYIYLRNDFEIYKDIINLSFIQRNHSKKLKGIGDEFYDNLSVLLTNSGFRYVKAQPLNKKLEKFWKSKGFVKIEDLAETEQEYLFIPEFGLDCYFNLYVHKL
ncbi:MAG: hypothetical protein ACOYT4_00230 [Nanoarchaeota archaeon]